MDPRPYNYQFRRPRLNNPTYQSYNAYESLYHLGKTSPLAYTNNILSNQYNYRLNLYQPVKNNLPSERSSRAVNQPEQSRQRYEEKPMNYQNSNYNRSKSNHSDKKQPPLSSRSHLASRNSSVLSNYGSSSLQKDKFYNIPTIPKDKTYLKNTSALEKTSNPYLSQNSSEIFQRQQRPFNIINLYSRHQQPLRKYPKLTQQNRILEKGMDIVQFS